MIYRKLFFKSSFCCTEYQLPNLLWQLLIYLLNPHTHKVVTVPEIITWENVFLDEWVLLPCSESMFWRHWSTYVERLHTMTEKQRTVMQRCFTCKNEGAKQNFSSVPFLSCYFFQSPQRNGALTVWEEEEEEEVEEEKKEVEVEEEKEEEEEREGWGGSSLPGWAAVDHLEQCWAPHLLLHCSSARQRRELHVAPKDHRKTRTRSLHLLDSGFCSSVAPRSLIPISMHTHAVPLPFWATICIFSLCLCLTLLLPLRGFITSHKHVAMLFGFQFSCSMRP